MGKITEMFNKLLEKWKKLSVGKKAAIISVITGVILILIYLGITTFKPKYSILFSDLDPKDSGNVVEALKEEKVDYKIEGNSILVPKERVSAIKMEMLSKVDFSNGSKGLELFNSDGMVSTDFENSVKYQKALQGEVERMIKSFEEVKDCKVILKLPEKDTFAIKENPENSTAAVYIKLNPGIKELKKEQVKAIVSLLTGAIPNLPKENVHVAVNDMQLVTEDLFQDKDKEGLQNGKQLEIKQKKEETLKKNILDILKPIYGEGVKAAVNVDLNFDAVQTQSKDYAKGVVVSEHIIKNNEKTGDNKNITSSPVDNNMTNRQASNNDKNNTSSHEDVTKNYNVPEVTKTEVQAPGKIQKITASIAVDETNKKLDDLSKEKIRNTVASTIGFDEQRGDTISVQGFSFKNGGQDIMDSAKAEMQKNELDQKKAMMEKGIAIAIASIIALIVLLIVYKKVWGKDEDDDDLLDETLESEILPNETEIEFEPIVFEDNDQKTHIESEVKKYAQSKPDQVADIVKSWLAEDER